MKIKFDEVFYENKIFYKNNEIFYENEISRIYSTRIRIFKY